MIVGMQDDFSTPVDSQRAREEIGDKNVLVYKVLDNMSHQTFNYGKDMSFTDDIISFIIKNWLSFMANISHTFEKVNKRKFKYYPNSMKF